MTEVKFLLTGDTSVSVEFGNIICGEINHKIRAFNLALLERKLPGIVETVPTYRSLMVHYDPEYLPYEALICQLKDLLGQLDQVQIPLSSVLEIPVLYGGEAGPDLNFVAEHCGKKPDEVIRIPISFSM